mgnify:CR=1 FL=1
MKRVLFKLVLSLTLLCFIACEKKETSQNEYADFIKELNELDIHTSNILVYKNGEIIFQNADGIQNIDGNVPLTLNSQFRLASVSKQFTGMAIMKLKEHGKLDYDQTVQSILSEFPYETITVRHLLNHVSGLTDYMRIIDAHFKPSNDLELLGNNEIIEMFYEVNPPLDFQPEEKWAYSNTGYMFLASIVEELSGKHLRDFFNEQIFEPIGMEDTMLFQYQTEPNPELPNRVFGYQLELDQVTLKANDYNLLNKVRGDGGIYSTLNDLYKWNQALVNYTIIPKEYLDEAWKPTVLKDGTIQKYGFGWGIDSDENEPMVVSHSGGWVGFATYLYNEVHSNSGFIYLSNNSGENFGAVLRGLSNIMKGESYELPKKSIEKEMAKTFYMGSTSDGINAYHKLKNETLTYESSEANLNVLGYQLMNEKKLNAALAVFKLNLEEYPNSANTYDSYGDALLEKGDSISALKHFQKSFEMDSTLTISRDKADNLKEVLN